VSSQSISDASKLLTANLHEVFSERDPDDRWAAIERTYSEDVQFIEPDRELLGRQALNDRAQELLDGAPEGFVLEEDGPRYFGTDAAALAWRLGPPGAPVARGIDILTVDDGRVTVLRTLLASETDG
jgi:SnoaL-like domain